MLQRGWRRECRQQDSFTKRHNFHPPPFVPEGKQSRPYRKAAEQKWRQEIGRCGKKGLQRCIKQTSEYSTGIRTVKNQRLRKRPGDWSSAMRSQKELVPFARGLLFKIWEWKRVILIYLLSKISVHTKRNNKMVCTGHRQFICRGAVWETEKCQVINTSDLSPQCRW